jgi:hypothetical protein
MMLPIHQVENDSFKEGATRSARRGFRVVMEMRSMKPKNSLGRRARSATKPAPGSEGKRKPAVILDFVQSRIEAFNREHGGGVFVRKESRGYNLMREEDALPVARIRPRTRGQFEVLYWSPYDDRWRPVGPLGKGLSLDDALELIADDPMDCFWR